jgi:hypothetical protein
MRRELFLAPRDSAGISLPYSERENSRVLVLTVPFMGFVLVELCPVEGSLSVLF